MMNNTEWTKRELAVLQELKNKETAKAFGRCSEEEQTVFGKAGKLNCLFFDGVHWVKAGAGNFVREYEYVIQQDFQPPEPEPEFVDCPVFPNRNGLCFNYPSDTKYVTNIYAAPGLIGFQYFFSQGACAYVPFAANRWFQDGRPVAVRFKR